MRESGILEPVRLMKYNPLVHCFYENIWSSNELQSNIWIFIRNRRFIDERDYLAGVAAPASLLTHRVRGCNEIYHLK